MSLFDKSDDALIEEYKSFLNNKGYSVIKLNDINETSITSLVGLVDFFYSFLQFSHPERKIHFSSSKKKDLSHAKRFLESRMLTGVGRKRALQECAEIIRCVIINESSFNLSRPISSMDCFGQSSMKWLTDAALSIINRENIHAEEETKKALDKEIIKSQEEELLSTIDSRIEELKVLKQRLGVLNGN